MTHLYRLWGFPWDALVLYSAAGGVGNGGLGLNILSRRALCFWFWQEALQRSRPDFISRSQGRVRELERRAQERRELADSVDPQSDAALRQRRAYSAWSTSLNGIVPAATLTSLIHCAAHCPIAAAVAVCHVTNHTHTDIEQRAKWIVFSQCVLFFKAHTNIFGFKLMIGNIFTFFIQYIRIYILLEGMLIHCNPPLKPKTLSY